MKYRIVGFFYPFYHILTQIAWNQNKKKTVLCITWYYVKMILFGFDVNFGLLFGFKVLVVYLNKKSVTNLKYRGKQNHEK